MNSDPHLDRVNTICITNQSAKIQKSAYTKSPTNNEHHQWGEPRSVWTPLRPVSPRTQQQQQQVPVIIAESIIGDSQYQPQVPLLKKVKANPQLKQLSETGETKKILIRTPRQPRIQRLTRSRPNDHLKTTFSHGSQGIIHQAQQHQQRAQQHNNISQTDPIQMHSPSDNNHHHKPTSSHGSTKSLMEKHAQQNAAAAVYRPTHIPNLRSSKDRYKFATNSRFMPNHNNNNQNKLTKAASSKDHNKDRASSQEASSKMAAAAVTSQSSQVLMSEQPAATTTNKQHKLDKKTSTISQMSKGSRKSQSKSRVNTFWNTTNPMVSNNDVVIPDAPAAVAVPTNEKEQESQQNPHQNQHQHQPSALKKTLHKSATTLTCSASLEKFARERGRSSTGHKRRSSEKGNNHKCFYTAHCEIAPTMNINIRSESPPTVTDSYIQTDIDNGWNSSQDPNYDYRISKTHSSIRLKVSHQYLDDHPKVVLYKDHATETYAISNSIYFANSCGSSDQATGMESGDFISFDYDDPNAGDKDSEDIHHNTETAARESEQQQQPRKTTMTTISERSSKTHEDLLEKGKNLVERLEVLLRSERLHGHMEGSTRKSKIESSSVVVKTQAEEPLSTGASIGKPCHDQGTDYDSEILSEVFIKEDSLKVSVVEKIPVEKSNAFVPGKDSCVPEKVDVPEKSVSNTAKPNESIPTTTNPNDIDYYKLFLERKVTVVDKGISTETSTYEERGTETPPEVVQAIVEPIVEQITESVIPKELKDETTDAVLDIDNSTINNDSVDTHATKLFTESSTVSRTVLNSRTMHRTTRWVRKLKMHPAQSPSKERIKRCCLPIIYVSLFVVMFAALTLPPMDCL